MARNPFVDLNAPHGRGRGGIAQPETLLTRDKAKPFAYNHSMIIALLSCDHRKIIAGLP